MAAYGNLEKYLLRDYWDENDIHFLLAGYDPATRPFGSCMDDHIRLSSLDGSTILTSQVEPENFFAELNKITDIASIWKRCKHDCERTSDEVAEQLFPIDYCIKWAKSKRIDIPWLERAIEGGYLKEASEPQAASTMPPQASPTENDTEGENRLRLIRVLIKLLCEEKKTFHSQNQLINHIIDNYEGRGLGKSTLEKTFGKANNTR